MSKTVIEYADHVWNPITGCTKVSEGCRNCWAERFSKRLKIDFSKVTFHQDRIDNPKFPRKPSRIFVCSMSDLFYEKVKEKIISEIFVVMQRLKHHTFLILTKRPQRMSEFINFYYKENTEFGPPKNIWLGVSVEDQKTANERIPILLQIPAAVRWVSAEPLLGEIDLFPYVTTQVEPGSPSFVKGRREKLDWLVTGGESGPKARPSHPDWFRSLRDQCKKAGVPYYFKQWGNWAPTISGEMRRYSKKIAGRRLDGREWNEIPGEKVTYPYLSANGV